MEETLSFDFEYGHEAAQIQQTTFIPVPVMHQSGDHNTNNDNNSFISRKSYRQTVCRHWLHGLCMKGETCGFLHQYDESRMPVCRFFRSCGECREQDCVYKHTLEDIKDCNMYKLGFCPNGPYCRYKHTKQPGPPPSLQEVLEKIQHLTSHNYGKV